jgi:hypothetical protein
MKWSPNRSLRGERGADQWFIAVNRGASARSLTFAPRPRGLGQVDGDRYDDPLADGFNGLDELTLWCVWPAEFDHGVFVAGCCGGS